MKTATRSPTDPKYTETCMLPHMLRRQALQAAAALPLVNTAKAPDVTVSLPNLVAWSRPSTLTIKAPETIEQRVQEAFQANNCTLADFACLHVRLLHQGQPWGYEGMTSEPTIRVEVLEQGRRLKEMVSRAITLATNQVGVMLRAKRIDFINEAEKHAPDVRHDATGHMSYVRRMFRVANERYDLSKKAPCPDEVRLIFTRSPSLARAE
jgi:hypothetical protein